MRVIYVAGPYRSPTEWGVYENIRRAEAVAVWLWQKGWVVICPHKNTAFFGGACDDSVWLSGDLELLRRSDAICMLPGWEDSAGARAECAMAKALGKEVYLNPEEVPYEGR